MNTPQIFEINGEKFAAIPLDVYKGLVEDSEMLSDVAAYEQAKKDNDECFPIKISEEILGGANPIKIFREYRNITQAELSEKVKVSRAYIAELETGKKHGSVKVLKEIAKALGLELEDIV